MRRKLIATAIAIAAFALIAASAASLGGITTQMVGADSITVDQACDSDGVDVAFRLRWDPADSRFEVRQVRVTAIADACLGQRISMALVQGATSVTRGPSLIRVGTPDDNWRRWNINNSNIDASGDFDIHIAIAD